MISNIKENVNDKIESREDYFDYWRKFHEFKARTGLHTGHTIKLDCIYDELFELTPNLNNKWRVVFITSAPDNWECKYDEETVFDSYLMHDTDSEGRCNYCKPYPKKVTQELPIIVPRVWFDPKYQEYEKLNYFARQQFRRFYNNRNYRRGNHRANNRQIRNRRQREQAHQILLPVEILARRINRMNYV